jgi:CheY-like chemotaxis protein
VLIERKAMAAVPGLPRRGGKCAGITDVNAPSRAPCKTRRMQDGGETMGDGDIGRLAGLSVLVVEDEPLVSMALTDELERVGAIVLGPAASIEGAFDLLDGDRPRPDAAILDVELQRKLIYPVADLLIDEGIPFILTTGHDAAVLPERFGNVPRSPKPASMTDLLGALADCIDRE